MTYVLYDLVNHQSEIFSSTDVAAVMVLITQEDADAAEIDDKFLREPMSQNFTGALAPWHYMISVSEFFGVDGSQKLACVSKDIFTTLWEKCPDKRHAMYGGEGKKTKKEAKDIRPRAAKVKEPRAAETHQPPAQEEKPLRPLSSYPLEDQKSYWRQVQNTLGPAMIKFFYEVGAIPSLRKHHPLTYTRHVFSFDEIQAFFDRNEIKIPEIQITGVDLSELKNDVSCDYLNVQILQDYTAFDQSTDDPTSGWNVEGENLKIVGNRFDEKDRTTLTDKLRAIWKYEGEESLVRSGLTLDALVVDLLCIKPDLILLWEKCYKEVTSDSLYSTPPEDLLKKQSEFTRNFETKKWELAA